MPLPAGQPAAWSLTPSGQNVTARYAETAQRVAGWQGLGERPRGAGRDVSLFNWGREALLGQSVGTPGSILATPTGVSVGPGGTTTYNVSLSAAPASSVTVSLSRQSGSTNLSIAGSAPGWRTFGGTASGTGAAGNVWVADGYNHRIQVRDHASGGWTTYGSYSIAAGRFYSPRGVAVDTAGNAWVADTLNQRRQRRVRGVGDRLSAHAHAHARESGLTGAASALFTVVGS